MTTWPDKVEQRWSDEWVGKDNKKKENEETEEKDEMEEKEETKWCEIKEINEVFVMAWTEEVGDLKDFDEKYSPSRWRRVF